MTGNSLEVCILSYVGNNIMANSNVLGIVTKANIGQSAAKHP